MRLGHDIWHQIIQYFEHEGTDEHRAEKRTVLLNLAVTSRSLSSLALATLWKNMDWIHPITHVINFFTPDQEDPFLAWVDDGNDQRYWKFSRKPSEDRVGPRVREYFGRVRSLCTCGKSERTLWPILIAWFWKGKPLLPNLQQLIVYFDSDGPTSYHHLTLMVPPRLKLISTVDVQSFERVVDFYQHLLSQGCSPVEVQYFGDLRLPTTLTLFKKLNVLVVNGPYERERHRSPFSLLELLQQLPVLKRLQINLRTLQIESTGALEPFEHPTLKMLALEGTTGELYPFLSSETTCPSVKAMLVKIRFNAELTWKFLVKGLITVFPNMNNLCLQVQERADVPQLVFSDIDELLPQPIKAFAVDGVPNRLSRKDLQRMLKAWPKLRTLAVTGGKTVFNAETLLSTSTYRNLHTLHLPFNFIPLASPLVGPPATQENPIVRLRVAAPTLFPSTFKEKITLAQNLFTLLPELETVEMKGERLGAGAIDLQDIIKGIQAVVATRRG